MAQRLALMAMALVTTWSLWAWAEPGKGLKHPASAVPTERVHAPSEAREAPDGHASHEAEDEGPAPMNWVEFGKETPPFIALVINFGILVAGYYLLGRKPIGAALQNRRESIAKEIEDAQRIKREAEARAKTYQAKLDRLAEDTQSAREALVRAGESERDRILAEATAKAERMSKDAQFMVEQEMKQIRLDLWQEAVQAAVLAAEELLKTSITQADQERLAEDYLAGLSLPRTGASPPSRPPEPPARTPS